MVLDRTQLIYIKVVFYLLSSTSWAAFVVFLLIVFLHFSLGYVLGTYCNGCIWISVFAAILVISGNLLFLRFCSLRQHQRVMSYAGTTSLLQAKERLLDARHGSSACCCAGRECPRSESQRSFSAVWLLFWVCRS